jgi:hypothetical protein
VIWSTTSLHPHCQEWVDEDDADHVVDSDRMVFIYCTIQFNSILLCPCSGRWTQDDKAREPAEFVSPSLPLPCEVDDFSHEWESVTICSAEMTARLKGPVRLGRERCELWWSESPLRTGLDESRLRKPFKERLSPGFRGLAKASSFPLEMLTLTGS